MRRYLLTTLTLFFSIIVSAQQGLFYSSDRLSNSLISSICQDQTGYIWIGTDYGLNRFDGYRFVRYFCNTADTTSMCDNAVVSLCCDREGRMWVGTNNGFQRYDYATDRFVRYTFPDAPQVRVNEILQLRDGRVVAGTAGYGLYEVVAGSTVMKRLSKEGLTGSALFFSHMYEDKDETLWKGSTLEFACRTKAGKITKFSSPAGTPSCFFEYDGKTVGVCRDNLVLFDNGQMRTDFFEVPEGISGGLALRTAYKDHLGNVYVGTIGHGLFWIPKGSRRLQRHPCNVRGLDMTSTKIWAITEDRAGNIWVGCQRKGLLMIPSRKAQFSSWTFSDQKIDIGTHVSSICDGADGMTWCTVQAKGVYGFDGNGRIVAHPSAPNGVEYLYRDKRGGYWLGTSYGVYEYNPLTGAARQVTNFPCYTFNTITDDGLGHMYFSAFSKGMLMYDRATGSIRNFNMSQKNTPRGGLCNDWIMDLSADREGCVWAATAAGVCCYDPRKDTFKPHGWDVLLDDMMCYAVCGTSRGDMLIGTEQGLYVWYRKTNKVEPAPASEPLSNLMVCYMVEDKKGNIWCSTSMGIWLYDFAKGQWQGFVNGSGLTSHEYVAGVGLHDDHERIFFASGDGLTAFTPLQVHDAKTVPTQLKLTAFYIGGNAVSTLTESGGSRVTDRPVQESDHFTLSYLDNTFTLQFSLLNYADAANTIFEYRFNDAAEWSRTQEGQNSITFSHLASGNYILQVRAIDNGVVSDVQEYRITVTAPWYRTTLAYIIYVLLLVLLAAGGVLNYRKRVHRQMDEDKMKFLINATHDIRSPLTLIMSPLAKLKANADSLAGSASVGDGDRKMVEQMQQELTVIDRNSQRILNLVNQILDVRKIDKQQMSLHCTETDMKAFLESIYKVFEYNAQERGITYVCDFPEDDVKAWVDRQQFDKVVTNLLSNAFKYGRDGGEIRLGLRVGHDDSPKSIMKDYVEITVMDEGIGMRDDVMQHIFDRFYQAKNSHNESVAGTGIGLNLCKMIVDMHHGAIMGSNRTDGVKGSVFVVRIPLGTAHLSQAEMETMLDKPVVAHAKSKQPPRSSYRVLVVDDDVEIGEYISTQLGAYYHFTVRHNGKEGLKELLANSYDVVVSDVMMPEMDGFTMLRMLKTNVNISHIPVIMLTTQSDVGNRLEGLERGADAYMTKPFTMDELHLTIDNLISNHLRLKGKFTGAQSPIDQVESPEVKGNDEQLMERIIKSVNAHLSDSDYGVEVMCEEVGISRAHLYRKMKDLTGISVSEFVRNIRLEQAARLLKEQKLNITQVAYTVGFSSLGYFSTVFRKHFGISPREFIDQQ